MTTPHDKTRKNKDRFDNYLVEKGFFDTKSQAQATIMAGNVRLNDKVITKAGTLIKTNEPQEIKVKQLPFVSRGGFKLEKAVQAFSIDLNNKICLDVGASTGGFTDFMLQNGAAKVYAVDVGYGQLAWKLRQDERVIVFERTNIRNVMPENIYGDSSKASFTCVDVSFISVTKILENIKKLMNPDKQEIVLLIKPQFEAGRDDVPKTGVVRDKKIHFSVIKKVIEHAVQIGFTLAGLTYSPIKGPAGNIEYLLYLRNDSSCGKIENDSSKNEEILKRVQDDDWQIQDNVIQKIVEESHDNLD